MPLYTGRQFVRAFRLKRNGVKIDVVAFIQFNENQKFWEIDYCNKVTKDTIDIGFPRIQQVELAGAIMKMNKDIVDAHSQERA